eukprot:jgi/Mesen1/8288/ME000045S07749
MEIGGISREEVERLMFFEQAREQAAADYKKNPKDADNLMKWGRTLVELAQFSQGQDAFEMIGDAILKLEEALALSPKRHEVMWWLGNAHTTLGFQTADAGQAGLSFKRASVDPTNDAYAKSLEVSMKGPELHQEIQKQMMMQAAVAQGGQGLGPEPKAAKAKKSSELGYDIAGWVILTVSVFVWLGIKNMESAQGVSGGR